MEEVLKKKDEINKRFFEKTVQRLQDNSFEVRMKRRYEDEELRKKRKELNICRFTLQKALVKCFLAKFLLKSTGVGRELKIDNFDDR